MKSNYTMYQTAKALAFKTGPRRCRVDGKSAVAFFLNKEELRSVFIKCGFNIERVTWINMIHQWQYLDVDVPELASMKNKDRDWVVFFRITNERLHAEYETQLIAAMAREGTETLIA